MDEQEYREELKVLFDQWCDSTIDEQDVPRLMQLLREADVCGTLSQLMKETYLQMGDEPFFSTKEKTKLFLHIIKPAHSTNSVKRKIRYAVSIAASVMFLLGIGYSFYLYKYNRNDETAKKETDISAPTTCKALLAFAGGGNIAFGSAGIGDIAHQENVVVKKHDDGTLSFKGTAKKIVYNTLSVAKGSKPLHLLLADGTSILLNVASSITFPNAFLGKERRVRLSGEAYFEVKHDTGHPFIVAVGQNEIKDLGTHFNVSAYAQDTLIKVTLIEGKVSVNNTLTINPGQQAVLDKGQAGLNTAPDIQETLAWKNAAFIFNGWTAEAILSQLSDWYNFTLEYRSPVPVGHFSGSISRNNNLSQVLKILETAGMKFKIEKNKLLVL